MRAFEDDDDSTFREFTAWQRWQRDHTPIEYWDSLNLSYEAYVAACAEAEEDDDADA